MAGPELRRLREPLLGGALALAVVLLVLGARATGAFDRAELALLDARFRLRGERPPCDRIVLVGIDEASGRRAGRRAGAWKRSEHARVLGNLARAGASLIVLDVIFARPDPDPAEDAELAAALADGRVLLAADISDRNLALPVAALREAESGEGFVNIVRDPDGVVRRLPPPRLEPSPDGGEASLILPIAVEAAVQFRHPEAPPEAEPGEGQWTLGEVVVPLARGGMPIDFAGGAGTYPALSFWSVHEGEIPPGSVEGKIVLIGSMHPLQHDYYPVPFRAARRMPSLFGERTDVSMGDMYGIEIHAQALGAILEGRRLAEPPRGAQTAALVLLGAASGLFFVALRPGPWLGAGVAATALAAVAGAAQILFASRGLVVEVAPAILLVAGPWAAGLSWHRALDLRRRREVQGLFGRYVSPEVARHLLKDPALVRLGGRKAVLTVFFSDIRGFTSMSETLPPEEVAALLQEYFTEMTAIVFRHGGTLDKFIGDAIMVFFGDPIPMDDHAERAVRMALEMRQAMERLKARWRSEGRRTFDPGMGINTGEMVVGNTGSAERASYTVIGDNVNLAARLESNAGPGQILISAAVREAIPGADAKFVIEPLPPIKVKGKAQPVPVWQVTAVREAGSPG